MNKKFKMRLGRHLAFEWQRPQEKAGVRELKAQLRELEGDANARIRELEEQLKEKDYYIRALQEGRTYIKDSRGKFYRLHADGSVIDQAGEAVAVNWDYGEIILPAGAVVDLLRRPDGDLQEWARGERGQLIRVR